MNLQQHYTRRHQNGIISTVVFVPELRSFSVSAARPGESHFAATVPTLEKAKAMADQQSGCRQPCRCPPWTSY